MLAGTVLTDIELTNIKTLLMESSIKSEIIDDDLELQGQSELVFRPGFDHEFILVGDATEQEILLEEAGRLSAALRQHGIQHAYEIYDTDNLQIFDYEYPQV